MIPSVHCISRFTCAPAPVPAPGPGVLSTVITGGDAGSQSGSGTSTSTGSTTTFTQKLPGLAVGSAKLGTSVRGGSGQTVGSANSGTFSQVVGPDSLSTAVGQSKAGFAGNGDGASGSASTSDTSTTTTSLASNTIKNRATGKSDGDVGTAVSFGSFSQDP